ncbi:MAG: four helix bundle protein [Anaerolineaceae bacterium]|jgi:four helix bundle protein|nr:four helix bundle protein [Anaerolineaceae bacterium]OQY87463.1 MAG: four helix bundle protein [Anaerolineae bacterium UTCFX1]
MATAKRFEELEVWQRAKELTNLIYKYSSEGTFARDFGLRDQMRRAAVSIMSNIAEGFESSTQSIFIQYLGRAKGSAGEVRAQLYIAKDQGYISDEDLNSLFSIAEICSKQLARFIQYLETQPNSRRVKEDGVTYDVQP